MPKSGLCTLLLFFFLLAISLNGCNCSDDNDDNNNGVLKNDDDDDMANDDAVDDDDDDDDDDVDGDDDDDDISDDDDDNTPKLPYPKKESNMERIFGGAFYSGHRCSAVSFQNHVFFAQAVSNDVFLFDYNTSIETWTSELVNSLCSNPRFVVDSNGKIHLVTWDLWNFNLLYMTNKSGVWTEEPVFFDWTLTGDAWHQMDIALDSSENVHILIAHQSYGSTYDSRLYHATDSSGTMVTREIIGFNDGGIYDIHMAISPDDSIHAMVSGEFLTYGTLGYLTNESGYWALQDLGIDVGWDWDISILINNAGNPAFLLCGDHDVKVYTNAIDYWIHNLVDTVQYKASGCSLAFDSFGHMHAGYSSGGALKYAKNESGTWQMHSNGATGQVNMNSALNSNGDFYFFSTKFDRQNYEKKLYVSEYSSGTWMEKSLFQWQRVRSGSLTLDRNNIPHVIFNVTDLGENSDLKHRVYYGNMLTGQWDFELIDTYVTNSGSDFSPAPRIEIDASGSAHACFKIDGTGGGIYYSNNSSGVWATEQILPGQAASNVEFSIDMDSSGNLYVAYTDHSYDVYMMNNSSGSWVSDYIDSGPVLDCEIIVDELGNAIIVYSASDMRLASNHTGSWIIDSIASIGNMMAIAMDIDINGFIHIVGRLDSHQRMLVYLSNLSGSWKLDVLESYTYYDTDIIVDPAGTVHVFYVTGSLTGATPGFYIYANNAGDPWNYSLIDPTGYGYDVIDIEIDAQGNAHGVTNHAAGLFYLNFPATIP